MAWNPRCSAISLASFFLLFLFADVSATGFISDQIFEQHHSIGRGLLQVEKNCPVDFEFQNYTIITSQCKGPRYLPTPCCNAFKQFACPFAAELNDLTNNCASTMFNYINLAGNYPPGLFANECRGDKYGLSCNGTTTGNSQMNNSTSGAHVAYGSSLVLLMVSIPIFMVS
ncbi:GPI-anchored protein LLG1-like [Nymphaea colorata]|nr:GPI-anchored protein LLG1-like [Nymphaea colorata]